MSDAKFLMISTHSRAKAAGLMPIRRRLSNRISTHSRAKAAGAAIPEDAKTAIISTHSRAKAAGKQLKYRISTS